MRAIFFAEEDARDVASRLRRDGFEAEVVRERLQGEDDDEDHPWAVVADAPVILVELLVDEYDGWLDVEEQAPSSGHPPAQPPVPPLPLPTAPRRLKRPQPGADGHRVAGTD